MVLDNLRHTQPNALEILQSQSLTMLVQKEIERMIIGGELGAGATLSENSIAVQLGVSRGPVREALRALEQTGLVRVGKSRGVFVRQISLEEAAEFTSRARPSISSPAVSSPPASRLSKEDLWQGGPMVRASRFLVTSILGIALQFCLDTATAQDFPTKLIKLIVANSAGSPPDVVARLISTDLSQILGQQVVVENKPGASSIIGYEFVAKQLPADGHTIAVVQVPSLAILPATVKNLRFNPLKDLPPVIGIAEGRYALVSSSNLPWKTFTELVTNVKANPPGKMGYGSSSPLVRLPMEALLRGLGLNVTYIPYSAAMPYYQGLVAGEVQMGLVAESTARSFGEKLRVLAVTGNQRTANLPSVATFSELGFPQIPGLRYSLNVTAGAPKAAVDRLYTATSRALQQPEVRARFSNLALEILNNSSEAEAKELVDQARFLSDIAKTIGIEPE